MIIYATDIFKFILQFRIMSFVYDNNEKEVRKKNNEAEIMKKKVKGRKGYSPFIILAMSSPTSEVVLLPPMS